MGNNKQKYADKRAKIDKAAEGLVFKPKDHSYWIGDDMLDSPSRILKQITTFMFEKVDWDRMRYKAKIGTMTHELAEQSYLDEMIPTVEEWIVKNDTENDWEDKYKDEVGKYFKGMSNWLNDSQDKYDWWGSEVLLCDKDNLMCGIADLLLTDKDGNYIVGDFKTSAFINMNYAPLQLVMYGRLLNKALGEDLFKKGVLIQIKPDGTYQEYPFDFKDYDHRVDVLLDNFIINVRGSQYVRSK
ncbi:PD-(D/E)XK nuclease family protein [Mesoplasma lactucae]|uniref:Uncharacterized protein n=1 Tax=Mesoplasma lactucae ATCC 49193 TaxID=81460 RepID=A0A291IQV0_9MOLU|nr:PD-(D/E)XK nuclease family protein [Mesoplasma lactucae]ATG97153.1 hypothetical protein CP520_00025 [Mesoplasma lactucae ATCC 49193]ATZ20408.1 hypothetical protein MLACT_v1c05870 [Mesoplasma lactucae ATCC 49193]MCL8216579.1 hypothetical protein [Mesoplasma lactucae ATCC 49193]